MIQIDCETVCLRCQRRTGGAKRHADKKKQQFPIRTYDIRYRESIFVACQDLISRFGLKLTESLGKQTNCKIRDDRLNERFLGPRLQSGILGSRKILGGSEEFGSVDTAKWYSRLKEGLG